MNSEHDRPRCPRDGQFVADVQVLANDERLTSVTGTCRDHGTVALGPSWWQYDLWFAEEAS